MHGCVAGMYAYMYTMMQKIHPGMVVAVHAVARRASLIN
jgi:hypothetical protein